MTKAAKRIMRPQTNQDERSLLAEKAAALHPITEEGQEKLARIAKWLLGPQRKKGDIDAATLVVVGLPEDYEGKSDLSQAFRTATKRHKTNLSGAQARSLERAGIEVAEASVSKRIWKQLFGG